MKWQAPQFVEIDMNAEIGAYQRDPLHDTGPERLAHSGEGANAQPSDLDRDRRTPTPRT